jgi:hypothetical protein
MAQATKLLNKSIAPNNRKKTHFGANLPVYQRLVKNAQRGNSATNMKILAILSSLKGLEPNIKRQIIFNLVKSGNLARSKVFKRRPATAPVRVTRREFVPFWKFKSRRTIHPI